MWLRVMQMTTSPEVLSQASRCPFIQKVVQETGDAQTVRLYSLFTYGVMGKTHIHCTLGYSLQEMQLLDWCMRIWLELLLTASAADRFAAG